MSARDFTPRFKTITPPKPKKGLSKQRKATGQMDIFREILKDRMKDGKYYSEINGEEIQNPGPENFAHILSKAKDRYPLFMLRKDNIMLISWDQHHQYDHGSKEELKKNPDWDWVFRKAEQLKEEYKSLID